jgi:REP element-mobilizing transposase RayT
MARGVRKSTLFVDDVDRRKFLRVLAAAVERYGCLCFTYCLMGNHFHLVIQTPRKNISRFMQYLDSVYGKYFNRRHNYCGHVYEGRFSAPLIEDSLYLARAIAYIARNPVEAKLVKHAADWKWSSYRATVGKCVCPGFLTLDWVPRLFEARTLDESRRRFSIAVHTSDQCPDLDVNDVQGSTEFRRKVRAVIGATLYTIELPRSYRAVAQPPLDELFVGVTKSQRRAAILRAHVIHGYLLSEIARYLDLHPTTVSRIVNRTGTYR